MLLNTIYLNYEDLYFVHYDKNNIVNNFFDIEFNTKIVSNNPDYLKLNKPLVSGKHTFKFNMKF